MSARTSPRRERRRAETHAEIASLAMAQVAAGGPAGLSLTGIARRMGMTGPAIYRYYASRDALLARLVADAFTDLADAVAAASADTADGALRAVAGAYRRWAQAHPREYVLLTAFVPPGVPRGDLEAATRRALGLVTAAVLALAPGGARPTRRGSCRSASSSGSACTATSPSSSRASTPRWASTPTPCSPASSTR